MLDIKINTNSFQINKQITATQLFSNIKLSVSARLVLRCIVDFWNFKLGVSYPTQVTIAKCTGLTEVAVGRAVKELDTKGLITKDKKYKRNNYKLTLKLFGYLNLLPNSIYGHTQQNVVNTPVQDLGKNIIKNIKNTFLNSPSSSDAAPDDSEPETPITELEMAKITIKTLANSPAFAHRVAELKQKFNL